MPILRGRVANGSAYIVMQEYKVAEGQASLLQLISSGKMQSGMFMYSPPFADSWLE